MRGLLRFLAGAPVPLSTRPDLQMSENRRKTSISS